MHSTQPFTLKIFVVDGDPDGLRLVERSNWIGKAVVFPRPLLSAVKKRPEFAQTGVYLLIGPGEDDEGTRLYIGEGDPVRPRLENHHAQKDFWTNAIFFVSTQGQLNKAHVQFLEARLIGLAKAAKRAELDNSQLPEDPSLSESEQAEMLVFLGNMLSILPVLGVNAFDKPAKKATGQTQQLSLSAKGVQARGYESSQGFTVQRGSQATRQVTASFKNVPRFLALRSQLTKSGILKIDGDVYSFTEDYIFNSPSLAATIIIGNSTNGRTAWKNQQGKMLKELQSSEASH